METKEKGDVRDILIFLLIALAALFLLIVGRVIKLGVTAAVIAATFLVTAGTRVPTPTEAMLGLIVIVIATKKTSSIRVPEFTSKKLASAIAHAQSNIASKINLK